MLDNNLCRFYSPDWLSDLVVDALPPLTPQTVVDLGCGPGSLSDAAARRWPEARILTVDIDAHVAAKAGDQSANRHHVKHDVLTGGLARAIGIAPASADLVISNPPYRRTKRTRALTRLLEASRFQAATAGWSRIPVDLAFMAQALLLTRPGGALAFVVPDTLVSSEGLQKVRSVLLAEHGVLTVVQLPRGTFDRTDAQAFAIIILKNAATTSIRLRAVNSCGVTNAVSEVDAEHAALRLDCRFHAAGDTSTETTSLADLGVIVSRGCSTSRDVLRANGTIFHTTHFPQVLGSTLDLTERTSNTAPSSRAVIAQPGDILLARVDRSLERKVAMVKTGAAEISDCVLRLQIPPQWQRRVFEGLTSAQGQRQIIATARGTGARHISQKAVLTIRV